MIIQKFFIEGPLPDLNFLIASAKVMGKGKKRRFNLYAEEKRRWEEKISLICKAQGVQKIDGAVYFDFIWFESSRRRDPDNICAGGRKLILDALVKAGVLENDGWKYVRGFKDRFVRTKKGRTGVLVVVKKYRRQ